MNWGKSIELRDATIETREEFGHWEIDTVHGAKDKTDDVLISLIKRKRRLYVALRCPSALSKTPRLRKNSLSSKGKTQS